MSWPEPVQRVAAVLGKLGSALIAATAGPASAADAVVVVENGHDRDATRLDRAVTAQVSRKVGPLGDPMLGVAKKSALEADPPRNTQPTRTTITRC